MYASDKSEPGSLETRRRFDVLNAYDTIIGLDKNQEPSAVKVEKWIDGLFMPKKYKQ